MSDDSAAAFVFMGFIVGIILCSIFAWHFMTWNSDVKSAKEFFLDEAVYKCSVIHVLNDSQ